MHLKNYMEEIVFTENEYSKEYPDSFVWRKELEKLYDGIVNMPFGKFLVIGVPGMGKTTLLHVLENKLIKERRNVVRLSGTFINKKIQDKELSKETIYFIDGLDEAYNGGYLRKIVESYNCCFVCTSRKNIDDIKFDIKIELNELSLNEVLKLIDGEIGALKLDRNDIERILLDTQKLELTPLNILLTMNRYIRDMGLTEEVLLKYSEEFYQRYAYGKGINVIYPKMLVPKRDIIKVPLEIKDDIKVINKSLLDKIARKPELLYELTPRQFEEVVCELFERKGYHVKLTKQTRDGGKDIIVINNSILGDLVFYAECKKYAPKYPVGVGLVRELYGTVMADRATAGILVTSSYFTNGAREFRGSIKAQMNLIDYTELVQEIQKEIK